MSEDFETRATGYWCNDCKRHENDCRCNLPQSPPPTPPAEDE